MGEKVREIVFYRTVSGACPVEAFLDSLPGRAAQKVTWVLKLGEDLERVPAQYFCKLSGTEDIWEFRAQYGSNSYRILCFFDGPKVVLSHGFMKRSDKTPVREIEQAEVRRKDHMRRRVR